MPGNAPGLVSQTCRNCDDAHIDHGPFGCESEFCECDYCECEGCIP